MGRRNIPDRLPQDGTSKGNYFATGMGNDKGSISFGHIHEKGDVTSGVMLRTPDGNILQVWILMVKEKDGLPLLGQETLL